MTLSQVGASLLAIILPSEQYLFLHLQGSLDWMLGQSIETKTDDSWGERSNPKSQKNLSFCPVKFQLKLHQSLTKIEF